MRQMEMVPTGAAWMRASTRAQHQRPRPRQRSTLSLRCPRRSLSGFKCARRATAAMTRNRRARGRLPLSTRSPSRSRRARRRPPRPRSPRRRRACCRLLAPRRRPNRPPCPRWPRAPTETRTEARPIRTAAAATVRRAPTIRIAARVQTARATFVSTTSAEPLPRRPPSRLPGPLMRRQSSRASGSWAIGTRPWLRSRRRVK
mmetsp:Transcript_19073/g.50153  ORF Transcript_19073/g.50153 Transcript_19073/m.50153 type:complete len:202 (+) Transcript_19073:2804-3409(+)